MTCEEKFNIQKSDGNIVSCVKRIPDHPTGIVIAVHGKAFYDDLLQNDLFELFDAENFGNHQIAMAHGRDDYVINPDVAKRFADKFLIPLTWFPGEGHSLSNSSSTPDQVADLAIEFYRGETD